MRWPWQKPKIVDFEEGMTLKPGESAEFRIPPEIAQVVAEGGVAQFSITYSDKLGRTFEDVWELSKDGPRRISTRRTS